MCGIAGHFRGGVTHEQLKTMSLALQHRGPDDAGTFEFNQGELGLVHRRLSIIDLSSAAAQPFTFENLVTVYNGEIYNFAEIREVLKTSGYHFETQSDTEVLIKAFHCWREKAVDRFNGMFAFAVFDTHTQELFLFRDRLGIKPLYYSAKQGLVFASELQAIRTLKRNEQLDGEAIADYFRFGFVRGESTVFKEIKKLKPGHYLRFHDNTLTIKSYWTVAIGDGVGNKSEEAWADELEQLLISSFKYTMVADVPVGVFLSGGIDSTLVAAVLQKHFGTINTLTIGFEEQRFNEAPFARAIAEKLGTRHHEKRMDLEDAKKELRRFYNIYDEPFADSSGIPVSLISDFAKSVGIKVVLSADGGDELFGGYPHYLAVSRFQKNLSTIPRWMRYGASGISRFVFTEKVRASIKSFNLEHRLFAGEELLRSDKAIDFYESYIANQSKREVEKLLDTPPLPKVSKPEPEMSTMAAFMNWDLHAYLPDDLLVKVDRATMFHSIEGREPFLDHRLVEFAARLPIAMKFQKGQGKYLLRKVLSRYLPTALFDRAKQGFSIPIFDWFSTDLDSLFADHLTPSKIHDVRFINSGEVAREWQKYAYYKRMKKEYNIEKMWRILSFMMWSEKHG